MNRRDFIKGFAAALAATQIPLAEAEASAVSVYDYLTVNGEVVEMGWEELGKGWFRVWKAFKPSNDGERLTGVVLPGTSRGVAFFQHQLESRWFTDGIMTASVMVKPGGAKC